MPAPRFLFPIMALAGLPCAGVADEGGLSRRIELPAHESLQAVRDAPGAVPVPFETDGCSGGMSYSWRLVADRFPQFAESFQEHPPWEDCCVVHDRAYHLGGASSDPGDSFDARLQADQALRACVAETGRRDSEDLAAEYDLTPEQVESVYDTVAGGMYLAVRLGGGPCTGLPWRWGFGWPGCSVLFGSQPDPVAPQDGMEKSDDARD